MVHISCTGEIWNARVSIPKENKIVCFKLWEFIAITYWRKLHCYTQDWRRRGLWMSPGACLVMSSSLSLSDLSCINISLNCISHRLLWFLLTWFISPGWCKTNLCMQSRTMYNLLRQQISRTLFTVNELVGPVLCPWLKRRKQGKLFSHRCHHILNFRNWEIYWPVSYLWWLKEIGHK